LERDERGGAFLGPDPRRPARAHARDDELDRARGEASVERLELRDVADAAGIGAARRLPQDADRTRGRLDQAQQGLEKRGLAAAVGTEDAGEGAAREREGDVA